ncbi:hypothetical protein AB1N83_008101 [Pleurotus pulmonarius]
MPVPVSKLKKSSKAKVHWRSYKQGATTIIAGGVSKTSTSNQRRGEVGPDDRRRSITLVVDFTSAQAQPPILGLCLKRYSNLANSVIRRADEFVFRPWPIHLHDEPLAIGSLRHALHQILGGLDMPLLAPNPGIVVFPQFASNRPCLHLAFHIHN